MENRTFDQQGQPLACDQLQVPDLWVNAQSGETKADGPGWLHSVRRGSANPLGGARPALPARPAVAATRPGEPTPPPPPQPRTNSSACTSPFRSRSPAPCRCAGTAVQLPSQPATAPLLNLTFADQVRAAYAPVDRWDATIPVDDPDRLGPQGMTARCDQLSVAETFAPAGSGAVGRTGRAGQRRGRGRHADAARTIHRPRKPHQLRQRQGHARAGRGRPPRRRTALATATRRRARPPFRPKNALLAENPRSEDGAGEDRWESAQFPRRECEIK